MRLAAYSVGLWIALSGLPALGEAAQPMARTASRGRMCLVLCAVLMVTALAARWAAAADMPAEWTPEQARKHWQPMVRPVQHVGGGAVSPGGEAERDPPAVAFARRPPPAPGRSRRTPDARPGERPDRTPGRDNRQLPDRRSLQVTHIRAA